MSLSAKNFMATILERLCAEIGAEITFEPDFERAGFITFANGRRHFFLSCSFNLNGRASGALAEDKDYAGRFLAMAGLNVPEGVLCFSPRYIAEMGRKNSKVASQLGSFDAGADFAAGAGYPVIVKPNDGAEGTGVRRVLKPEALRRHMEGLFDRHDQVLVQRPCPGDDYRLVVLDDEVLVAYQRRPLSIVGDGHRTIGALAEAKIAELRASGRTSLAKLDRAAVADFLSQRGFGLESILEEAQDVPLLPNANLSTGGSLLDVSDQVCPAYREIAVRAVSALGLRFAGVDILSRGLDALDPEHVVLEVNFAPGLHNFGGESAAHYAKVLEIYRRLLRAAAQA